MPTSEEIVAKISALKTVLNHLRDTIYQADAAPIADAAPSGDYGDEIRAGIWLKELRKNASSAFREIKTAIEKLEIQAKLNPMTEHIVEQGDTWERLSMIYYGTPHDWPKIMAKNKKTEHDLVLGEVLVIPQ